MNSTELYCFNAFISVRIGIRIVQRNVRKWCTLRSWPWFRLLGRVKPLIKDHRKEEELEIVQKRCKELEDDFLREEKRRRELEANSAQMRAERAELEAALGRERDRLAEAEAETQKLASQKGELERQVDERKN